MLLTVTVIWVLLSLSAVLLEEYALRPYTRGADIARLALFAILEPFGYRQMNAWWGCRGLVDLARKREGWGTIERRGLERPTEAPRGDKPAVSSGS